jgi:hypothetical protein
MSSLGYWRLIQLSTIVQFYHAKEEFEETKGAIRNRTLKDRQHNGQKTKETIYKQLHRKLKIEQHELH